MHVPDAYECKNVESNRTFVIYYLISEIRNTLAQDSVIYTLKAGGALTWEF
jgi:hypothetical protein